MADTADSQEARADLHARSNDIVSIDTLAQVGEIEKELELAARRARFQRSERWEDFRQYLVLFSLGAMALVLLFAFLWSAWVLLPTDMKESKEVARWVLETEVAGLVAGLIGLWVVKSFEK